MSEKNWPVEDSTWRHYKGGTYVAKDMVIAGNKDLPASAKFFGIAKDERNSERAYCLYVFDDRLEVTDMPEEDHGQAFVVYKGTKPGEEFYWIRSLKSWQDTLPDGTDRFAQIKAAPAQVGVFVGGMTAKDLTFLKDIGEKLKTQNGRITSHPVFEVRVKKQLISAEGYSDDVVFVNNDGDEVDSKYVKENDDGNFMYTDPDDEEHVVEVSEWHVQYVDEVVMTFLTEAAADRYVRENRHNMLDPFTYVTSAYRNHEIVGLQDILKRLK